MKVKASHVCPNCRISRDEFEVQGMTAKVKKVKRGSKIALDGKQIKARATCEACGEIYDGKVVFSKDKLINVVVGG